MWQVEVIKINIQEMLSLDYRTYITSRIRLKSASCFSGLWIKTIPKHLVHTASKYFAISKFTLFFSRTYDHLCQSSLWSMQKFSADPDKLPVDFAKTSLLLIKLLLVIQNPHWWALQCSRCAQSPNLSNKKNSWSLISDRIYSKHI